MTDSFQPLLKDVINLLEQCPVTSDTDWVVRRNDIIVRSRQVIKDFKKEDTTVVHETAPKQIWLHLNGANEWLPFKDEGDVVWSEVKIDDSDIPYVRDDYATSRENESLTTMDKPADKNPTNDF
jgi:hypothetical protein